MHVVFPDDVLPLVFAFLVEAQSICNIQRTCRTSRRWNYDTLQEWKLDWVYKNVEEVLGAERTIQLRDGLLTDIDLSYNNIGVEGAKAIGEALKVNTSLKTAVIRNWTLPIDDLKGETKVETLNFSYKALGVEDAIIIAECLKVNTSLTKIHLDSNSIN